MATASPQLLLDGRFFEANGYYANPMELDYFYNGSSVLRTPCMYVHVPLARQAGDRRELASVSVRYLPAAGARRAHRGRLAYPLADLFQPTPRRPA